MQQLEAEVWRALGRQSDLGRALPEVGQLVRRALPAAGIVVRQLEPAHRSVATVAGYAEEQGAELPSAEVLATAQWRRLRAWCQRTRGAERVRTDTADGRMLVGREQSEDVLAGPLKHAGEPAGILLLLAEPGAQFTAEHQRVASRLLDPFSSALANYQRMHELATLREAAEAERQSLLARLGRSDLTETVVGADGGLKRVMERVALVARSDAPVLLLGETGTGKEVIARAVHLRSARHAGPFMRVNCGAIPSELIDSQLFGHEKGSFTGAAEMRQGWFERADGGTLFLDEIGELPLAAQVRLLRVLQDGYLERVGGQQSVRVDVRIIAATHRNLAAMVESREFREDLWYRLAVFPILLPPLRERLGDIPDLARHFAQRAAARFGLPAVMPTPSDIELLAQYTWPGNVRELGTVIDRAAILGDGKCLEIAAALGASVGDRAADRAEQLRAPDPPRGPVPRPPDEFPSLDDAIRDHIRQALRITAGRIEGPRGAAQLLKMNPHTLRSKMRKLGIDWNEFRR